MHPSFRPDENPRLTRLNDRIRCLFNTGRISYDRTRVLTEEHTKIDVPSEGPVVITIKDLDSVRRMDISDETGEMKGTCRELAQHIMDSLLEEKIVDNATVWACATLRKESHYVVVAEIDGQKYIIDLAYSQPVLEAIPVDGNDVVNTDYDLIQGSRQPFGGDITYNAKQIDETTIIFALKAENGASTEFILNPLTEDLDKRVAATWVDATGKGYSTRVELSKDTKGKVQVNGYPIATEIARLSGQFSAAHTAVREEGRPVLVRYSSETPLYAGSWDNGKRDISLPQAPTKKELEQAGYSEVVIDNMPRHGYENDEGREIFQQKGAYQAECRDRVEKAKYVFRCRQEGCSNVYDVWIRDEVEM